MATSDNRFQMGLSQSQWLDLYSPLVQFKVDKPGGVLPSEASNTRSIAEWFNTVDDLMLAAVDGTITGVQPFEYIDNTASPIVVPTIPLGQNETLEIDITTDRNMLELTWFSLTRVTASAAHTLTLDIAQDSGFDNTIFSSVMTQRSGGGGTQD